MCRNGCRISQCAWRSLPGVCYFSSAEYRIRWALFGLNFLLSSSNLRSLGVCVVNIDNGIGVAAGALRILNYETLLYQRVNIMFFKEAPIKFSMRLFWGGLFILIGLELFFRFGMHAKELPRCNQDLVTNIFNYDTSWVREGTNTWGALCKPQGHWRINNNGWNSIFDYSSREDLDRPRIAILGNSYLEGFTADVESLVDAELYRLLKGEADVYSFGLSGATFAQYLAMVPYIESRYNPDVYLILLSSFGISRSLDSSISPYRFFLEESESGFVLAEPQAVYSQNKIGRLLFRSALARYIRLNKQMFSEPLAVDAEEIENTYQEQEEIPLEHFRAGEYFVTAFRTLLPNDMIIFFSDGECADFRILSQVVLPDTLFSLINIESYMSDDFALNGIDFSREDDPHWNNYGLLTVANALLPYILNALRELGY